MYVVLIISSYVEGDLETLRNQISYLEKNGITVVLSIDPTEIELLRIISEREFDCVYVHVKRRFIGNSEGSFDLFRLLEQNNMPTLGNSYITQLLIADKYTTSKKSGIGLQNWVVSKKAFIKNCFEWASLKNYPLIVKPNTLHASMGITEDSVVYKRTQVKAAIKRLFDEFQFLQEVLIEQYIAKAQEYTVSVLGNNNSLACSVSKLQYKSDNTCRINSKKQKELPLSNRTFNFVVEENELIRQRLKYHAITLFHHFGMRDIARFDFILDKKYYLLEANTNPMPGNSFSWEWQIKWGLKKEQIIALYLCAFHFGRIASGKPSRFPVKLIRDLPKGLISKINSPSAIETCPECSGYTDNCKRAHLFTMNDRVSSENEVHNFLMALTRLIKPKFILETGTYKGSSTIAFAEGLRQNNFGHMVTLEIVEDLASKAQILFDGYPVEVRHQASLTYIPHETIDLLFLDSKRDIRGLEFDHFLPYLAENALVVWHDSSYRKQNHSVYDAVEYLYKEGIIDRLLFPTPRGLTLSMLRK